MDLDLDFCFVPVEGFEETAATTREDDEGSWFKDKKRCRFEAVRVKGW